MRGHDFTCINEVENRNAHDDLKWTRNQQQNELTCKSKKSLKGLPVEFDDVL